MAAEARKPVSKRTRFEVFKRDMFSCQYCGKKSPDVVLHVDHIKPVSNGGKNTITNLITACQDCNLGKSNIELGDDAAIKKQANQTLALAERDEQISMMVNWQEALLKSEEKLVLSAAGEINRLMTDRAVSDHGMMTVRKAIKKNGYESVMSQISKCYASSCDADEFISKWGKAIQYKHDESGFSKTSLSYAKGILRKRFTSFNDRKFYAELGPYKLADDQLGAICEIAKQCGSLPSFFAAALEVCEHGKS